MKYVELRTGSSAKSTRTGDDLGATRNQSPRSTSEALRNSRPVVGGALVVGRVTRNRACLYGGVRGGCAIRTVLLYTPVSHLPLRKCNTMTTVAPYADISLAWQTPPALPHKEGRNTGVAA